MADTLVDVPGVGRVAFPEGMSGDDIADAIRTKILPQANASGFDAPSRMAAQPSPPPAAPFHPSRTSDYIGTRLANVAANLIGTGRAASDMVAAGLHHFGLTPVDPVFGLGQYLPSAEDARHLIYDKIGLPNVNTPGEGGKMLDTGVETAIGAMAGGPRALLPGFVGGATSQVAGDIPGIKGTVYEPFVRAGTGLVAGGLTALGQNAAGNVVQGVRNSLALGAPEQTATRIIGNALNRDKMTADQLAPPAPNQPLVIGGGENVKGALRGSIAAPGQARTTAGNAFTNYLEGGDTRVGQAIDQNISGAPPLSTRTSTLDEARAAASGPAYRAAGVPDRPAVSEPTPTTLPLTDANGKPFMVAGELNTPIIQSDKLDNLIANSADVKAAIANARRLPDFKDLPANSMSMLDKAYKHLGGLEQEAIRAGNGTRANDLHNLRTDFRAALTEANPAYGEALAAYSEPSQLMAAGKLGSDLFRKNVNNEEVARQFNALPADQQQEFLGGVADYFRTRMGNSDRGVAAERIWNGSNVRDRLKAILPPDKFAAFDQAMNAEKLGARVGRDVFKGSRTVPMGLEAADNAGQALGVAGDVVRGRYGSALLRGANALAARIGQGRTEAVNNEVARMLTETDPAKIGLVRSLAERARLDALARSQGRRNALLYGAGVPALLGAGR